MLSKIDEQSTNNEDIIAKFLEKAYDSPLYMINVATVFPPALLLKSSSKLDESQRKHLLLFLLGSHYSSVPDWIS